MTFRTTLRETRKSRQIALIVIFREKYARLSSPQSASGTRPPKKIRRPVWALIPGVPIGCRSPRKRGSLFHAERQVEQWIADQRNENFGLKGSVLDAHRGSILDAG